MDKEKIRAELDAFIESGKAKVEVNSGNFVTTHIDMLRIAEHFYEQVEKGFMEKALTYLHNKLHFDNVFYGIVSTDFNSMEEVYEDFKNYMKEELI